MKQNEEYGNEHEEAGLEELIEIFENYLRNKEQIYLDDEALERILEFYESRNDDAKAEAVVDFAIEQNPYSSDFIIRKAEYLLNRKKYREALDHLDRASLYDTGELDIYLIRSDIFVETNRIDRALQTLHEALEIVDDDEKDSVYSELSDIYEIKEDFPTALDCLVKALTLNPAHEESLHKIAHLVDMTESYDQSVELHQLIVDKDPYIWLAWYNLGRAWAALGLYEKALEAFEFVMAINEEYDYVYRDAADIYYRLGNFSKSVEMFETAQEKSGGFEDYSFRIGLCHERLEDYKSARFSYRKATRQDPYMDEAFFRIGETYRIEERYEAALVNYKKALKLDETNEDYLVTIISVYRILDRDADVISYMNILVQLRPDILTYWIDLLTYLYELGSYAEVADTAREAISKCGHYAEFQYIESAALFSSGKEKEALQILESALTTDFARHSILLEVDSDVFYNQKVQRLLEIYRS